VSQRKRILSVVGTRPEAIKMAPVVRALRAAPWADARLLTTGQHQELLDAQLAFFDVAPDRALDVMRPGQALAALTAALLEALDDALTAERPDLVLAQGDTTTVLATALACCYRRVPFGHVEAGLRTGDLNAPFPEEANRVVADQLAALFFAPTQQAAERLRREGRTDGVFVTGNPVVDALLWARARLRPAAAAGDRRLVLVTTHRRENIGAGLAGILEGIRRVAARGDVELLLPVHPNPEVHAAVHRELSAVDRVTLAAPLDYADMVRALDRCHLVLTDSGGLQEEAPALDKPVLVLRDVTERPEGVAAGAARLVGTDPATIAAATAELLDDPAAYRAMSSSRSPYGDGHAAERIVACCRDFLEA